MTFNGYKCAPNLRDIDLTNAINYTSENVSKTYKHRKVYYSLIN